LWRGKGENGRERRVGDKRREGTDDMVEGGLGTEADEQLQRVQNIKMKRPEGQGLNNLHYDGYEMRIFLTGQRPPQVGHSSGYWA